MKASRQVAVLMIVSLVIQLGMTTQARAADEGQSTRSSDQQVIFCNSDWSGSVTYFNQDQTSAYVTSTRSATCLFGARANIWLQFQLVHTPLNGPSYVYDYMEKNPNTTPGCLNVTSCSFSYSRTVSQVGWWQLNSWAHFQAYPNGTLWQWPTKGISWQIKGSPGPYRATP